MAPSSGDGKMARRMSDWGTFKLVHGGHGGVWEGNQRQKTASQANGRDADLK